MTDSPSSTDGPTARYISVRLTYDETSKQLQAELSHCEQDPELNWGSLQQLIVDSGYENFKLPNQVLEAVLRQAQQGEEGIIRLGEKPEYTTLSLHYNNESRVLSAELSSSEEDQQYSWMGLQDFIRDNGYESCQVTGATLKDLLNKIENNERGEFAIGKKPEYTLLTLEFDEQSQQLKALLSATDDEISYSLEDVQTRIEQAGYQDFFFPSGILDSLINRINKLERGCIVIAERRDATVNIELSNDLMTAFLTATAPAGGKALNSEMIQQAIAEARLDEKYLDHSAIQQILSDGQGVRRQIAQGKAAQNGKNAKFEALVDAVIYHAPVTDNDGNVDHHDIKDFVVVDEGQPLMRRTPATTGVNGVNVLGEVIMAETGEDTPFQEGLEGASIDPDNSNQLISTTKGHPVIMANGVTIDKTLKVTNVNGRTGDINFDGSVLVTGDVDAGMHVSASGDIHIKGVITHAQVKAAGNISIGGGVIGGYADKNTAPEEETSEELALTVSVEAGKDIQAQYLSLGNIKAGGNIEVKEYISHCYCHAEERILSGQQGGKGYIIGGNAYAAKGVAANALGNEAGIRTYIKVGLPETKQNDYQRINEDKKKLLPQMQKLSRSLHTIIEEGKTGKITGAQRQNALSLKKALEQLKKNYDGMTAELTSIKKQMKNHRDIAIEVKKQVFGNSYLYLNGLEFIVRIDSKGGRFSRDGEIVKWE